MLVSSVRSQMLGRPTWLGLMVVLTSVNTTPSPSSHICACFSIVHPLAFGPSVQALASTLYYSLSIPRWLLARPSPLPSTVSSSTLHITKPWQMLRTQLMAMFDSCTLNQSSNHLLTITNHSNMSIYQSNPPLMMLSTSTQRYESKAKENCELIQWPNKSQWKAMNKVPWNEKIGSTMKWSTTDTTKKKQSLVPKIHGQRLNTTKQESQSSRRGWKGSTPIASSLVRYLLIIFF